MEVTNLQSRDHWIFKKHTNNIDILVDVALNLKERRANVSSDDKKKFLKT